MYYFPICPDFKNNKYSIPTYDVPLYMYVYIYIYIYTGLFISPAGISELDCATNKTDTAERCISIGRESLQFFCTRGLGVLPGSTARGSREEKWRSQ